MVTSKEKFKNLELIIKEKKKEKATIILEKIEREGKLETLKDDLKEMFTYILDSYLSIKLTKMITDLLNDYFEFCEEHIKNCYNSVILWLKEFIMNKLISILLIKILLK